MYFRSNESKGHCYTCPNRHCCFCKNLLTNSPAEFNSHAVKNLALTAKQYLYRQGDMNSDLFVLREGWVLLTRLSEDGKRQVFRSVLPGDIIGFQQNLHSPALYSAITLLDSVFCSIPNIETLCSKQPELGLRLASASACDLLLTEMYLANITQRSARRRIAFMALELYHRLRLRGLNEGDSIQFPLKQEDIADTLGLTTVHDNRTLHAFKEDGLFKIHKHKLTILDYEAICSLVGSDLELLAPAYDQFHHRNFPLIDLAS